MSVGLGIIGILFIIGMATIVVSLMLGFVRFVSDSCTSRTVSTGLGVTMSAVMLLIAGVGFLLLGWRSSAVQIQPPQISVPLVETPRISAPMTAEAEPLRHNEDNQPIVARPTESTTPAATSPTASSPPAPRPEWVGSGARLEGSVYLAPVATGLFPAEEDCNAQLTGKAAEQVGKYLNEHLGRKDIDPQLVPEAFINQRIIRQRYIEPVRSDVLETTVYRGHALLVFDTTTKQHLEQFWREHTIAKRLWATGGGAASALTGLGLLWGILRMPPRTKKQPPATAVPDDSPAPVGIS